MARGGWRRLGGGGRRGDPAASTGPTGVRGLEQERGCGKAGGLEALLIQVRLGELVILLGHLGLLIVGSLGVDLLVEVFLRSIGARPTLGHVHPVGLVHLCGDVGLGGGSLLGGSGGRDDLPTTTRRGRLDGCGLRGRLHAGLLGPGGGNGI